MKKTLGLIFKTTQKTSKSLPVNWFLYSLSLAVFNIFWVLLPERVSFAIVSGNPLQLFYAGVIGFGASAALFFSTYLSNHAWMKMNRVRYSILLDLLDASLQTPFSKTLDAGFLAEMDKARHAAMNPAIGVGYIMSSMYELPGIVLSAAGLFGIVSRLSLFLALFVLVSVFISFRLNRILNQKEEKEWNACSSPKRMHERVYDIMMAESYAKDIRLFSLSKLLDTYGKSFSGSVSEIQKNMRREKTPYHMFLLLNELLRDIVVFTWIAVSVSAERTEIGAFLTYALGILQLSRVVQSILSQSSKMASETRRFSSYWNIVEEAKSEAAKIESAFWETPEKPYTIEFENVSFTYPNAGTPAIQNVSFKIEPGRQTALVGLNGAGKSTIIKLLCRLYSPSQGQIRINGIPVESIPKNVYYSLLSVVLQTGSVLPYSVQDNITMSKAFAEDEYRIATTESDFHQVQDRLPKKKSTYLSHIMDSDGIELSGGERQKLLLSRAIYHGGQIFLFDEPAGAIDPVAEEKIYCRYREITRNATSLVISHQLSFVSSCDYIIMLEEGRIKEQGTHEDLMGMRGKYYEMYMEQKRQYEE